MAHPFDSLVPSPDAQHSARFAYGGEIRFGPLYFGLSVDGFSFGERIFGDVALWSPSSTLVAVQEWLTIDYAAGPITELVLIDLSQRCEAALTQATKAFLVPVAFEETTLVYRSDRAGQPGTDRFKVDITTLSAWRALA